MPSSLDAQVGEVQALVVSPVFARVSLALFPLVQQVGVPVPAARPGWGQ